MGNIILHLCADIGSDSRYYQLDPKYSVICVGKETGVENFNPPKNVHGIIANPVCTEFSTAKGFHKKNNMRKGMFIVDHCLRIIKQAAPKWWVLENPAMGKLRTILGDPKYVYQPWQYGSPWTKKTALWGDFIMPRPLYDKWEDVPKNDDLYVRPGRLKPSLAFLHKSAIEFIPEFDFAKANVTCDADFRSLCSQGFAKEFYKINQ
ncbi:MAG: hypothetical protein RBR97_19710 [Bacteroidales bacterium]|nr:hypothetical protein [Bacteroidales bacterium]